MTGHYRPPDPKHRVTCRCGRTFAHRGTYGRHQPSCLGDAPTLDDLYRIGRVEILPNECHEWRADYYAPEKYGLLPGIAAKQLGERAAHRASYTLAAGPIPDGLIVLHECDNPPCVNPEHLRAGTHAQNSAERYARGRARKPETVVNRGPGR